ncbi:MAG: homoserine O-acetyltransferase [Spirochaetes bacterium]|jgi:homoserine O-acetyltransferase|nr:homoserine O-acetyltransferase [Spirochaetota bacterium]
MIERYHAFHTGEFWTASEPLQLESGETLSPLELAYNTWGELNEERDNAVIVAHGFTANSDISEWWGGLLGEGRALDPTKQFIVCINSLASPYGSTSPLTYRREGRSPREFPAVTIRDTVHAHKRLVDALGIRRIHSVVGVSLGGHMALEWAIMYPGLVGSIVTIGSTAKHSPWCIGISATQRAAITSDPAWQGGEYSEQPRSGLGLARQFAMISYRSSPSFTERFGRRRTDEEEPRFEVESYLDYQGHKLVDRFDANCYIEMTRLMDTHDVGRDRGDCREVLSRIRQPALVLSVSSDVLYPAHEQLELARAIPGAEYGVIRSDAGHDGFLIEHEQLVELLTPFVHRPVAEIGPPAVSWAG